MQNDYNIKFHKAFLTVFIVLLAVLAVFCAVVGMQASSDRFYSWERTPDSFVRQYTYLEYDDEDTPAGIRREYVFTCPKISDGDNVLAVYMIHQYGAVHVDGELRVDLHPTESRTIGRTPGNNWLIMPLFPEDSGHLVTISTKPAYSEVRRTPLSIRITTESQLFRDCFGEDFLQLIISILVLCCGMVFLMTFLYFRHYDRSYQLPLLYISLIGILTGIWKLTELRFMDLMMFGHTKALSYISAFSLMLMLAPMTMVIAMQTHGRYRKILRTAALAILGFDALILILQLLDIVDVRQLTYLYNILLFGIILAGTLIMASQESGSTRPRNYRMIILFLLCLAGVTIDVTSYFVTQSSTGSIYTLLSFLLIVTGFGLTTARGYIEQQRRLEEQEKELAESRISIMISQIQPHFLYNSLASIYYLCDEDPQRAKQAIDQFSTYLRMNMDSLKQERTVDFSKELEHVRNYLSLEKMRYEDRLTIFYNIETTDFMIPALSVQPIVENAVRHGVSKLEEGGTVIISSYEKDDCFEITVEDDGVGFDPEKGSDDKSRSHVGIENVRTRLRDMCGGTMMIDSEIGFGTTVTIRIPKDMEETK